MLSCICHELAKGCIYEPSVAAHVVLVPRLKTLLTDTHIHKHTHLSHVVRDGRGQGMGGSGSDRPLIPADPLIKDKIFESTDRPFLKTTPFLLEEEGLLLGENNVLQFPHGLQKIWPIAIFC